MNLTKVEHIAIVVKDLDRSLRLYRDVLGLRLEEVEVSEKYQAKVGLLSLGGCLIELIQGTGPESEYTKFVEERGEGLHHLCFEVDDIERALNALQKEAVPLRDRTWKPGHQGSKIAFLDPSGANGVLLEICEKPKP